MMMVVVVGRDDCLVVDVNEVWEMSSPQRDRDAPSLIVREPLFESLLMMLLLVMMSDDDDTKKDRFMICRS